MKKRVILFFCVAFVLLALPIGFSFASEECEHTYVDDNDCSTPVVCQKCNETVVLAKEHNFSNVLSYSLEKDETGKDNFFKVGTKKVRCSNEKCYSEKTMNVQPFISTLGYAIKEDSYNVTNKDGSVSVKTEATIISTYLFNTTEIEKYAALNNVQIKYGMFVYKKFDLVNAIMCEDCKYLFDGTAIVPVEIGNGQIGYEKVKMEWKDIPSTYKCPQCDAPKSSFSIKSISPFNADTAKFHNNVYIPNKGEAGKINDLSIMKIGKENYNAELVIAGYILIGNKFYYVQNNKLINDYNDLVSVTCDKILEKINKK